MSVYPKNLSHYLNRLSGYNKNNVRLNVLGSTSANQGDIIQVDLPSNSICDLGSLAWSFRVVYAAQTGDSTLCVPEHCEALIDSIEIEVNGQSLCRTTNYNTLFHALLYMTATEDYQRQRLLYNSNRQDETANGKVTDIATGTSETQTHVIDTWLGFLGSAKPNFIDTSLLGNVKINIQFNSGDIMCQGATAAAVEGAIDYSTKAASVRTFTIDQQHFSKIHQ